MPPFWSSKKIQIVEFGGTSRDAASTSIGRRREADVHSVVRLEPELLGETVEGLVPLEERVDRVRLDALDVQPEERLVVVLRDLDDAIPLFRELARRDFEHVARRVREEVAPEHRLRHVPAGAP